MINGKRLQTHFPDIVKMQAELKEDERIIYDIESGYPYKVKKEYYDYYMKLWESAKPKIFKDGKPVGVVFISGTGSDGMGFSKCSEDLKEMFYNPENYNLKEYGEPSRDSEAN